MLAVTVLFGAITATTVAVSAATIMSGHRKTPVPPLSTRPTASVPGAVQPDPTLGGGPGCEPVRTPTLVRGNGVGSEQSGPDVILAFEHGYYVARSGEAAHAVAAVDSTLPPAAVIQSGLDTIVPGSVHCVAVIPIDDDRYSVTVTETHPDHSRRSYAEIVTTVRRDGRTLIASITGT